MSLAGRNGTKTSTLGENTFGVFADTLAAYRAALLRVGFPEHEVFGLVAALQASLFDNIKSEAATPQRETS